MSQFNFSANSFLSQSLQKREDQNALRKLLTNNNLIDFCSNDYLGFAQSPELQKNIEVEFSLLPQRKSGSGGSRLLAGNSSYAEDLEKKIAAFHNAESGLIFNSGYDANIGLFSSVLQKNDTIIYDELIHASIHDGIRLSKAKAFMFKHNNIEHLEERLRLAEGTIYVAIESIYSMDGDESPLEEIVSICKKHNANLIVDEAHATGITKNSGKGLVQLLGYENDVFARVHTFGKALGCHGAIVLGSNLLRNFLINYSRSFIYTTALPIKSLIAINQAYLLLEKSERLIHDLHTKIVLFKNTLNTYTFIELIESTSPIQCIINSGNSEVKKVALYLQKKGFDIRPILSPTVPKGKERLRICLHTFNNEEELQTLIKSMVNYFKSEKLAK